jgi:uncharacterized protein YutE (UPF0331/DUF86 family)
MVLRRAAIEQRLKELDEILQELDKYRELDPEALRESLSQRWIVERGLIAAASVILEVPDHILVGHFGTYVETYEDSLQALQDKGVISAQLYNQIRGLGGFRNILVHRYLDIDSGEVFDNFQKALFVFPAFAQGILTWLDSLADTA